MMITRHKKNSTPWRPFWTPSTDLVMEFRDAAREDVDDGFSWKITTFQEKSWLFLTNLDFSWKIRIFKKTEKNKKLVRCPTPQATKRRVCLDAIMSTAISTPTILYLSMWTCRCTYANAWHWGKLGILESRTFSGLQDLLFCDYYSYYYYCCYYLAKPWGIIIMIIIAIG